MQPAAPRRRTTISKSTAKLVAKNAEQLPPSSANTNPVPKAKKLPAAAVEATAMAFLAGFKALPGTVQWRVVQLIEEYEDELAEAHDAAERAANPEDYDPKNSIPWEQVKAEYEAKHGVKLG